MRAGGVSFEKNSCSLLNVPVEGAGVVVIWSTALLLCRIFAGIVSIKSYSCLESSTVAASGSGGGAGVAEGCEASGGSPSTSTPRAESPNAVRRDVGNRRGHCRPKAGRETVGSIGARRHASELPGRAGLVNSRNRVEGNGASSVVGIA